MDRFATLRRRAAASLVVGLAPFTAACGGDGASTPTPTPTPANAAPAFTSPAQATTDENTTAVLTPAATDPEGDAVTITISGGADAAAFKLTGDALAFAAAPNFDRPTDANADNVYEVTLTATDTKGAVASQALRVQIRNDHEGVTVTRIASGLGADAVVAPRYGEDGLIAISQDGTIRHIDAAGAVSDIGAAFEAGESGRVLAVGEGEFFTVAMLYGALGDPTGDHAQDPASGYGKLFTVEVDPYCGASLGTTCVYRTVIGDGVHAPSGGGEYKGQSYLVDRGADQQEEVDFFNQDARPLDFGWPYREGTFVRMANPPAAVNGPSLTYPHGTGVFAGQGLTGTTLYSGPLASLKGDILLTDQTGAIFAFPAGFLSDGVLHQATEMENRTADFAPATGAIERPVAIVSDRGGRLFVLDGDGELYAVD